MIVLGLHGPEGSGKDTIADWLVKRHSFIKFAFSDPLYREVQLAYGLPDQSLLRGRATKELPTERLMLRNCSDADFVEAATAAMDDAHRRDGNELYLLPTHVPLSPRQILQWWGTDYRRAQSETYWLERAADRLTAAWSHFPFVEQTPQFWVECGTRFENEREFIKNPNGKWGNWRGNIWHVHSDRAPEREGHVSSKRLPVLPGERQIWNNDTITRLRDGVSLLLTSSNKFVKVLPMYQGPWCCEKARALQVPVCPDCAEASAG